MTHPPDVRATARRRRVQPDGDRAGRRGRPTESHRRARPPAAAAVAGDALLLALALVLAIVVKAFFVQAFFIPSESMDDTSSRTTGSWSRRSPTGAATSAARRHRRLRRPRRLARARPRRRRRATSSQQGLEAFGLYPTGGHLVKRVIGVGGDEVMCCDAEGRITVNGVPLNEQDYLVPGERPSMIDFDIKVPEGYAVGHGRQPPRVRRLPRAPRRPRRRLGPGRRVVGKVLAIVWPLGHAKMLRPARDLRPGAGRVVGYGSSMSALPRGLTVRRDAGLYGYERALRRAGLDPSPASTRPAAAPAPGRWSPPPRPPRGQARRRSPGSPTPSCSPRAPASGATTRCSRARWPGRWWSCEPRRVRPAGHARRQRRGAAPRAGPADVRPSYVLTDGFPVDGLEVPGLAVWKGDRVAACIAAASVIAKVTRDRIMARLHDRYPHYDFDDAQGLLTPSTPPRWSAHGPCESTGDGSSTSAARRTSRPVSRCRTSGGCVGDNDGSRAGRRGGGRDERGGPREVRDRDGAPALPRVPRRRRASSSTSWRPTGASTCATRST